MSQRQEAFHYTRTGVIVYSYKNNKLDGESKIYEYGKLIRSIYFKNGYIDGEYKKFENGKLIKHRCYNKSKLYNNNYEVQYFQDGELIKKCNYTFKFFIFKTKFAYAYICTI